MKQGEITHEIYYEGYFALVIEHALLKMAS
jgi:hypothetical protein